MTKTHPKISFHGRDARFLRQGAGAKAEMYGQYIEAEPQAGAKNRASDPKCNFEMGSREHRKKSIAILGPGAIGGFLGAVLWKSGYRVHCIGTDAGVARIREQGLHLVSKTLGEFVAYPLAEPVLTSQPDILIVSTKAPMLTEALARAPIKYVRQSIIIPFLNGFEHIEILRRRYGNRIAPGSISIEVMRSESGIIHHLSPHAAVGIASEDISSKDLEEASRLFIDTGISCRVHEKEGDVIWDKLVRLNAITCAIAASGMPLGFVRSDPKWRRLMEACVREAGEVARRDGSSSDPEAVMARIERLPASLRTSLARDIAAGNIGELDAIAGAIVRKAARYGIATPVIASLIEKISSRCMRPPA